MSEFVCEWDLSRFSAVAVYTGENRLVRVQGIGICPQAGFTIELVEVNPGVAPEPERLHLGLLEKRPESGATVMTDAPIEGIYEVSPEVNEVDIRGLGLLKVREPA